VQIHNFKAELNPRGGRVDLSWVNPAATEFPGFQRVRILRREFTEPVITLTAGVISIEIPAVEIYNQPQTPGQSGQFSDRGLKGETVYYYAIVAEGVTGGQPVLGPMTQASALATTGWLSAEELYRRLPALYQRYDLAKPPAVPGLDEDAKDQGQLRRLVEMFGLQFDLLRSFAGGMRDFSEIDRIDGVLLPLLAGWIGWPADFTLSLAKQRNEIRYAPHYFRTAGVAANLQATVNRLTKTDWEPQIKEFVHNVFLSNAPEQLYLQEVERPANDWPAPAQLRPTLVTLDVAYEGRPFAVRTGDEDWLFYHARQSVTSAPSPGGKPVVLDNWHVWLKIYSRGAWLPARRLSFEGEINKYPTMARGSDGNMWLFYSSHQPSGGERVAEIRLRLFDAGRAAQPARLQTQEVGPFDFADGDQFRITIQNGAQTFDRIVTLRAEHFPNIAETTAAQLAALLERELPGVTVAMSADATADGAGTFAITTLATGASVQLTAPPSTVATKLKVPPVTASGANGRRAQLEGARDGSFTLNKKDTLLINVDGAPTTNVTFESLPFPANMESGQFTADVVAAAINRVLPGVAEVNGIRLRLKSPSDGEASFISVDVSGPDVNVATAALNLGFGVPPPGTKLRFDDTEPVAFADNANRIWLFWSSRRNGRWQIWYNRFNDAKWDLAKPLTSGIEADREPAVVFDRGAGGDNQGTIRVFWSRRKNNGRWNIFYLNTTTSLQDFAALNWTAETELTPDAPDHDRNEPAAILLGTNNLELYFSSNQPDSSNRTNGRQIWMTRLTPAPAAPVQITTGPFTHRAPFAVKTNLGARLWFRGNESQTYASPSYPAAQTLDARYAGSTTADTRNAAKLARRKRFDDVLRYSYDTKKGQENWYARDTVGIYYEPDINDPRVIEQKLNLIASVLRSVLPIQVRAVFIKKP
jgi:hypothetical protein